MIFFIEKFYKDDKGTAAIEFALLSVVFLSLTFGTFESGRMFLAQNSFQYALENASRQALVNPDLTEAQIQSIVLEEMSPFGVDADDINVSVVNEDENGVEFINVSGTYDFETVLPLLPAEWNSMTFEANSRFPLQDSLAEDAAPPGEDIVAAEDNAGDAAAEVPEEVVAEDPVEEPVEDPAEEPAPEEDSPGNSDQSHGHSNGNGNDDDDGGDDDSGDSNGSSNGNSNGRGR